MDSKITREWIELDPTQENSLTSEYIPYDSTGGTTIHQEIQAIKLGQVLATMVTEEFILDATDITNKFVVLEFIPIDATAMIKFIPYGGPNQFYRIDFAIKDGTTKTLSWSANDCTVGLEGILLAGDIIRIEYIRELYP